MGIVIDQKNLLTDPFRFPSGQVSDGGTTLSPGLSVSQSVSRSVGRPARSALPVGQYAEACANEPIDSSLQNIPSL